MADCYDCIHAQVKGTKIKCSYTGEDVKDRDRICSKFANEKETNICEDCDYYEFGAFSKWNSNGKCSLTGQRKRDDDIACAYFRK